MRTISFQTSYAIVSDGASHPGYRSYYPAQLLRELPLNPRRWELPRSVALALPVGELVACLETFGDSGRVPGKFNNLPEGW